MFQISCQRFNQMILAVLQRTPARRSPQELKRQRPVFLETTQYLVMMLTSTSTSALFTVLHSPLPRPKSLTSMRCDRYLQYYHPFLPILRHKEPNSCYDTHPILFWTILYVSSRRFSRDETLYTALVEELSNTPWLMLSTASATLESVHALLIVCNWPLPTIRFLTDPCPSLLAVATVACMQLGLHLGKGTGEAYGCGERHNAKCSDEEAASTWFACCTLSTKYVARLLYLMNEVGC